MKILLLLFLPVITFSQFTYKGNIVNKITKEKIPFATVGLIKENIGTNADEDGKFILKQGKYETDSLVISCVGYETSKFPVNNLPLNFQYEISEKQIALKTIIVKSSFKASYTLNDYASCGLNSYYSSGSVTQIAQHLQSPESNSLLSEINICKQGDNSLFRIRVYDMDSITGKPSADLADTIIEVRSGKRHVQIDLEKYNIVIPGKDFFVAIEWLYIPYNESEIKINNDGQKKQVPQFSPFLFFRNQKSKNDDHKKYLESWQLDYRGKWFRMFNDWVFLISATVKS